MQSMKDRITELEANVNAMAQAWLYLAAHVEQECGTDLSRMEDSLRQKRWPNAPAIDAPARAALHWLCDELDQARAMREAKALCSRLAEQARIG